MLCDWRSTASACWKTPLPDEARAGAVRENRSGKPTGRRWQSWHTMVVMGCLGWVFMYADRTVLSPVLPLIGAEWDLSQSQLGLIASLFFLAYAVLQIPVGMAADRLGRRLVLLVPGFVLFGIGTLLSGLSPTYGFLLFASVLTGLGEGTYYPTQFALSTEMVPPSRRGISAAIITSGQAVGISLGLMLSSYVALGLGNGWRPPFIILSVPTVLTGLAFWLFVKEPRRAVTAAAGQGPAPVSEAGRPEHKNPWSRNLVLLYALNFCSLYGFFVVLTWLPSYLQTARGYGGPEVGWISSLVPWMAVPGGLIASWLSDRSDRKRIGLAMLPVAAVALVALPLLPSAAALMAALVVYGLFGKLALDPVLAALVADLSDRSVYGTVFGAFNFAGMASSVVAPYLTGFLADRTGTLNSGFYLAAALLVVGIGLLAMLRQPRPQVS